MAATRKLSRKDDAKLRILNFGDSLTEGYTDFGTRMHPYGGALRSSLQETFPDSDIVVDIKGSSGDCVLNSLNGDFESRLRQAVATQEPPKYDLVIILGGTNDLAYNQPKGMEGAKEIFEEGLKPLYEHVLDRAKSNLVVVTVPERAIDTRTSDLATRVKGYRLELNRLIMEWAKEQENREPKVFIFDLAPKVPFAGNSDQEYDERIWSPDGLHMSSNGYDFFGRELAKFIGGLL